MLNKKKRLIELILTGIILAIVGLSASIFLDKREIVSRLSGLIFALGFGLIGESLGGLYKIRHYYIIIYKQINKIYRQFYILNY